MVVTLYTADIPGDGKIYSPRILEVAAAILYEDVRRGWPVLTGRSRGGLRYDLERVNASSVRMVLTDKQAYARYVAEKWYPLDRRLGPAAVREALAKALTIPPDATEIPSRLPDVDGMGASSRPVQIQGTNQNPPAPAGPPPPPANPTAAAQQKALGQIPDSQTNKPTAAAAVFAASKKVARAKVKAQVEALGAKYKATAVGPAGLDALDTMLEYAQEHYPETLRELAIVKSSTSKQTIAAVGYNLPGDIRSKQRLILSRTYFDKEKVSNVAFLSYQKEYKEVYWWKRPADGDSGFWDYRKKEPGEVSPPPGWMSAAEADQIRRAAKEAAQDAKESRWAVGLDGRFGKKLQGRTERLRATLIHELGHMFHNSHNVVNNNNHQLYNVFKSQNPGVEDWDVWGKQISDYGGSKLAEATAEAFAVREIYGAEQLPTTARLWLEWIEARPVGAGLDESLTVT